MKPGASIGRVLAACAWLAVAAGAAQANDEVSRKKPARLAAEQPKYKLDFSAPPTTNSPAPPPGTALLRREPDSGLPFLGLKLSTPLGN